MLNPTISKRVITAIEALANDPRPPGVRALTGHRGWLRVRSFGPEVSRGAVSRRSVWWGWNAVCRGRVACAPGGPGVERPGAVGGLYRAGGVAGRPAGGNGRAGAGGGPGGAWYGRGGDDHGGDRVRAPARRGLRHRVVGAGGGPDADPGPAGPVGPHAGPGHRGRRRAGGTGPAARGVTGSAAVAAGLRQRRGPGRVGPVPARRRWARADHIPEPRLARRRRRAV